MSLKEDIKRTLIQYGSKLSIRRIPPIVEVFDVAPMYQASKPFRLEHLFTLTCPYDSQILVGDIIDDLDTGESLIIVHKGQTVVSNEIVTCDVVAYKSNCVVDLIRFSSTGKSYNPTIASTTIASNINAVIDDTAYAAKLDEPVYPVQNANQKVMYIYVPNNIDSKIGDRIHVKNVSYGNGANGAMFYEVADISFYTFVGISILHVKEDNR